MGIIDTHAHLTSEPLVHDLPGLIERAFSARLEAIVNICTGAESLANIEKITKTLVPIFHAAATPPHDIEKEGNSFFPLVETALKEKRLCAVGETGLDYFYEHAARQKQKEVLRDFFLLAKEFGVPTIIHCREAFQDLFCIADECQVGRHVVLHCFTGNLEEALEAVRRGWLLSISGIVTFKKSDALRSVVEKLPLRSLVIETDAPYLAPHPYRGKSNEPSFIVETAKGVAALKGVSFEELAVETTRNAKAFFRIL